MSDEIKYAVLIDAENISPRYINVIFDEVSNYGVSTYRRIYGDWTSTRNTGWKEILLDNSITPIQQYSYTDGKNASDSAMIIDAMDILYTEAVDGFVLVSSDSDFTRLASRLRESGMSVVGMGESKTPKAFISACNSFKYLDIIYESLENDDSEKDGVNEESTSPQANDIKASNDSNKLASWQKKQKNDAGKKNEINNRENAGSEPSISRSIRPENESGKNRAKNHNFSRKDRNDSPRPRTSQAALGRAIRNIIRENSDDENWISLANLGNQLSKRFPDFDVRNYGHRKLLTFIESFKEFEVERRKTSELSGKQIFVRLIEDRK